MRRSGFTLVELLIVIIVIAVIAAVAVPTFVSRSQLAKESAVRTDLRHLRDAIDRFRADTGLWPARLEHLANSAPPVSGLNGGGNAKAISASTYKGPYLTRVPMSAITGGPFTYDTTVPKVGGVSHPAGRALDGTNYADW